MLAYKYVLNYLKCIRFRCVCTFECVCVCMDVSEWVDWIALTCVAFRINFECESKRNINRRSCYLCMYMREWARECLFFSRDVKKKRAWADQMTSKRHRNTQEISLVHGNSTANNALIWWYTWNWCTRCGDACNFKRQDEHVFGFRLVCNDAFAHYTFAHTHNAHCHGTWRGTHTHTQLHKLSAAKEPKVQ